MTADAPVDVRRWDVSPLAAPVLTTRKLELTFDVTVVIEEELQSDLITVHKVKP